MPAHRCLGHLIYSSAFFLGVIQAVATKQGETEVSTQGVVHADVSFGQPTELHMLSHRQIPRARWRDQYTSRNYWIDQVRPTKILCHRRLTTIWISHAHFPPSSASPRPLPLCVVISFLWALLCSPKTHLTLSDAFAASVAQFFTLRAV